MIRHSICRLCGQPIGTAAFLSVKDVAESLNVSGQYIRRLCAEGRLKAHHMGRVWLIERSSVDSYRGER